MVFFFRVLFVGSKIFNFCFGGCYVENLYICKNGMSADKELISKLSTHLFFIFMLFDLLRLPEYLSCEGLIFSKSDVNIFARPLAKFKQLCLYPR